MKLFVEIRGYEIPAGERPVFHRIMQTESLPLLQRWGTDVVAYGPSPHDDTSYVLVRAYTSLEARQKEQDAFYASAEWRQGPREAIVNRIAAMTSVVLELDENAITALRGSLPH
jgi:NIPSNAP